MGEKGQNIIEGTAVEPGSKRPQTDFGFIRSDTSKESKDPGRGKKRKRGSK